ncbi:hypothetical protein N657DRAFT_679553 [Parathielavia appendiculata]|uniref:Uncharacterized protein n=1 Tax=Parathielavia appendiculata TaxID=2587402 RepID=A0AAN6Z4X3_9PEZI|nr:hypothetical protein N657DRAFT_679553 [Parathielavia appendiculata]
MSAHAMPVVGFLQSPASALGSFLNPLNVPSVRSRVGPLHGDKLKDNVRGFCNWINKLRTQLQEKHASLGGIPAELADDVLRLLNHFFPSPNGVDSICPSSVDISYGQPSPSTPVCVAKPITVSFNNHLIEIADGPTALGYIFSIARMPSQVRPAQLIWSNYVVPLLAIYSRCLYLAYIASQDWKPRLLNVPWMACAMYFNDAQGRLAMLLGSTYAPSSADSGQLAAANGAKRSAMAL